jgi:hypothetical protein
MFDKLAPVTFQKNNTKAGFIDCGKILVHTLLQEIIKATCYPFINGYKRIIYD